jgi:hypothetical protein
MGSTQILKGHKLSTVNSTNALLGSGATFTGTWEAVGQYSSLAVSMLGTNATDGTLWIDVRPVGETLVNSVPFFKTDITSNDKNIPSIWNIVEGEFRVRYVNGSTAQLTDWWLTTKLSNAQNSELLSVAGGVINTNTPVSTTRSLISGQVPDGTFANQKSDGVAFRTEAALGIAGVYTSPLVSTEGYSQIETHLFSDVEGSLVGRWYNDVSKTTLIRTFTRPYAGSEVGAASYFSSPIFGPYVEYEYTNGGVGQATFFLDFHNRIKAISGQVIGLEDFIPPNVVANLGRTVGVSKQPNGTLKNDPHNGVCISTTANLGIGATFTSDWIDTDGYNSIELFITSDVESATRGIDIEFTDSLTGLVIQEEHFYSFKQIDVDRGYLEIEFPPRMVGFRIEYTNGAVGQSNFLLQSDLKVNGDNQRYNSGGALIIGDFKSEIALGNVPNHQADAKYGSVTALDAADPLTTIWSAANDAGVNPLSRKTFPTATGILHMASTSASDTAKEITIVYSDANNFLRTISANLNGQTPVSLAVTALDANTAYISGDDQTLVGDVFITLNANFTLGVPNTLSDTICYIESSDGRSSQATIRVPADSRMTITNSYVAISRLNGSSTSARVDLRVKPLGGSWYVLRPYMTTSSLLIDTKEAIVLEAGTVAEFVIDSVSDADTNCVAIFDYEIVEE